MARDRLPTRPVPYPEFDGTQACRSQDPTVFFPTNARESWYWPQVTRPLCANCTFLDACRDYAVSHDVHGFWGGLNQKERKEERERLGISPISLTPNEYGWVWDRLAEVDDGVTNAEIIAGNVGCSSATVQRWRRRRAGAA